MQKTINMVKKKKLQSFFVFFILINKKTNFLKIKFFGFIKVRLKTNENLKMKKKKYDINIRYIKHIFFIFNSHDDWQEVEWGGR